MADSFSPELFFAERIISQSLFSGGCPTGDRNAVSSVGHIASGVELPPRLILPSSADLLPIGIFTCDFNGLILQYNRQCATYWGGELEVPASASNVLALYGGHGSRIPPSQTPLAQALSSGKGVARGELSVEKPDGSRVSVHITAEPIFAEDGVLLGAVCSLQNTSEKSESDGRIAAQLAAIVASSDDAIVGKTLQGVVTSWNAGATRIFGYSEEEIIGQHITKIIPPELWSEEEQILSKLCRGEHIDHFETIRLAKDGRRVDVSVTVSPIRDLSGKLIGASKVGRDITERKYAQKVQELLISELNHRVKNTLATVQSIANQTVHRAKSPSDFAASFSGRLQGLSRTHNLLTATTWRGAEISEIIRDQLAMDVEDDRVSLSGPSLMLSPQATLHAGLVLHELSTNALKYGALSTPHGKLSLRWMVRTEGERKLFLQWQERGGPPVTVPQTRGFGSTLIEKSLDAHGGSTSIHYEAEGLTCEIMLPLKHNEYRAPDALIRAAPGITQPSKPLKNVVRDPGIRGKRILVVDDEPLIAMDIASSLDDEGCIVVGPASTVEKALKLIETLEIDAALLDANLAGDPVDAIAAALTQRKIAFAFVTGYGREGLPKAFRMAPLIKKPFERVHLAEIVQQLTADTSGAVPLRKQQDAPRNSHA